MSLEYLDDEELENLIRECESDLVQAPPELMDKVLSQVGGAPITDIRAINTRDRKKKEYNRFKWQMVSGLAASFVLVVALHALMPMMSHLLRQSEVPTKESILANYVVPTKDEVIAKQKTPDKTDFVSKWYGFKKIDFKKIEFNK